MLRSVIVALLLMFPSVASGQVASVGGEWDHLSMANISDVYGNNCIATAVRQERFKEIINGQSTMHLTQRERAISGYSTHEGVRGGTFRGTRIGRSVTLAYEHWSDSGIATYDIPGCGQWRLRAVATAYVGAIIDSNFIMGTMTQVVMLRQNNQDSAFYTNGAFQMFKR